MDRLRQEIRVRHYSIRTEQAYSDWARRFIVFHRKRHPSELGAAEVAPFLIHLAWNGILPRRHKGKQSLPSCFYTKWS